MAKSVSIKRRIVIEIILSLCIGLGIFVLFFGWTPLNVTNEEWIFQHSGDLTEHYLGWCYFRASKWLLPIGTVQNIAWPDNISVIYVDCIPWMAIFFKILSPILPATFQYMGIYVLLCFVLQIFIGMEITGTLLKKYEIEWNRNIVVLGGALFGLSAPMIFRMFYHTALSGHHVLLLMILLWLKRKEISFTKECAFLFLLGGLNTATHLFFVPIAGVLLIGLVLTELLNGRMKLWQAGTTIFSYILGALFVFTNLGGFGGSFNPSGWGAGYYSANLNTYINPMDWSVFLPSLPTVTDGQYEGFSYLGFGWIVLIIAALTLLVKSYKRVDKRRFVLYAVSVLILVIMSLLSAAGTVIGYNDKMIWENVPYPAPILLLLNIFRSHGRFAWAAHYIFPVMALRVIFFAMSESAQDRKKMRYMEALLGICFILQLVDFRYQHHMGDDWKNPYEKYMVSTDVWEMVSQKAKHIRYLPDGLDYSQHNRMFELADFALDHGMTMDNYYYARPRDEYVTFQQACMRKGLDEGVVYDSQVLIFDDVFEPMEHDWNLYYYSIDTFIVGLNEPLTGVPEIMYEEGIPIPLAIERNLSSAKILEDGNVLLEGGGYTRGPEWTIGEGHYELTLSGIDIGDVILSEEEHLSYVECMEQKDSLVVYEFDLEDLHQGVNIELVNSGRDDAILSKALLRKIW